MARPFVAEPSAVMPVGVPQSAQNFAPASSGDPHVRQLAWRALPHSGQNRALAGTADPHLEQFMRWMPLDDPGVPSVAGAIRGDIMPFG
jgi:hypothetical protein